MMKIRNPKAKKVTEDSSLPPIQYLSEDQGRRMFERQARKYLGMSGEEFIRKYRAGQIEDPDRTDVWRVAMLIPFFENSSTS